MKNLTTTALILLSIVFLSASALFAVLTSSERLLLTYLGEIILSLGSIVFAGFAIGELMVRYKSNWRAVKP